MTTPNEECLAVIRAEHAIHRAMAGQVGPQASPVDGVMDALADAIADKTRQLAALAERGQVDGEEYRAVKAQLVLWTDAFKANR